MLLVETLQGLAASAYVQPLTKPIKWLYLHRHENTEIHNSKYFL